MARHECPFLPPRRIPSLSTTPLKVFFGRLALSASMPGRPVMLGSDCHPTKAWWGLMASRPSSLGLGRDNAEKCGMLSLRLPPRDKLLPTVPTVKHHLLTLTLITSFPSLSGLPIFPSFFFPGITFQINYLHIRL